MFPHIYEGLEESFPQLRQEREIDEELRKAKLAHAYLQKIAQNDDPDDIKSLREYMKADSEFEVVGDGNESDEPTPVKHPKIDIRKRNNRRRSATMADLPQEDMFGFPVPPPKPAKTFPAGGKRLGSEEWSLQGEIKGLLADAPPLEDLLLLLAILFLAVLILRQLLRRSSASEVAPGAALWSKLKERDAEVSLLHARLEMMLQRAESVIGGAAANAAPVAPQYIILPAAASALSAAPSTLDNGNGTVG